MKIWRNFDIDILHYFCLYLIKCLFVCFKSRIVNKFFQTDTSSTPISSKATFVLYKANLLVYWDYELYFRF